ncbi:MAG: DUF4271 domain-containing protein [Bacteroidia bacterium]|nr:DUF4271 domain-containing protein [Bacteroidia bacterium]
MIFLHPAIQYQYRKEAIFPILQSERSHISDITFYDSANLITRIDKNHLNGFPYQFIEKNRQQESKSRASLIKQLRDGDDLAVSPFHEDWTVFIILIAAFFYASVPAISRKLFPGVTRFFLFRGIGEAEARDTGELFHWQSTIFNFISFSIIALFTYFVAYSYGALPASISGIFLWLIALGSVVIAITFRHISCIITGRFSGEKEAFDEYIVTFYQSYRYLALILFVLVILLSYTKIFSSRTLFLAGYISFAAFYMLRIVRLFLIFIKRNVSVLYLILYLCALEILPVAVVTKYITGLF